MVTILNDSYSNIVHNLLKIAKENLLTKAQKQSLYEIVMSIKGKTILQKQRFIMYYNLDVNQDTQYNLTKLAKYNTCTPSAIRFSIVAIKNKLVNLKDERCFVITKIFKQIKNNF